MIKRRNRTKNLRKKGKESRENKREMREKEKSNFHNTAKSCILHYRPSPFKDKIENRQNND